MTNVSKRDLSVVFNYITIKHIETSALNYAFKLDAKIWRLGFKWWIT